MGSLGDNKLDEFLSGLPLRSESFQARPYQVDAAKQVLSQGGSLVVMATALGKTYIALLVYAALLRKDPKAKCLFLAPTKPLVAQQAGKVRECVVLPGEVVMLTGEQEPDSRRVSYQDAQVVVATPQAVANDCGSKTIDLSAYSLIVFDEAHRAVGDYAYVPVAMEARKTGALLLGLTASPSSEREKVDEVVRNLGVKGVVYKNERDDDVAEYSNPVEFEHILVDLPGEMAPLRSKLLSMYKECATRLQPWGLTHSTPNRKLLLMLQQRLIRGLPKTGRALSEVTRAINVAHALDMLETEGVGALVDYIDGLDMREKKSRAVLGLLVDPRIKELKLAALDLLANGFEHPKMDKLKGLVQLAVADRKSAIVFVHYRASAERVCKMLNSIPGANAHLLVGRSGEGGMRQSEQIDVVRRFSEGEFNVLVCTQVGEEGLSIHSVDLVVFYEAVPSEIRLIQRRGRTGRVRAGHAIVLVAKGTKDEAYLWISKGRERKMRGVLEDVSESLAEQNSNPSRQSSLGPTTQSKVNEFL